MIKVLFVCAGNICRSPMAEAVFADMVRKAGLSDKIQTDSAGTGSWHVGEMAHRGTRNILKKHGITYDGRARQLNRTDIDQFDYIVAMDFDNMDGVQRFAPEADNPRYSVITRDGHKTEIAMFMHYANQAGLADSEIVPDPYYDNTFDRVYNLVTTGSRALLDHIRKENDL